ncbi:MAG: Rrf2 family transcriptional regulator [Clostridia bacterium]|nr:Rrf2 family transcriptional regulator [Clostridia bacterium]NCC42599.1 Rrf2 family transcriptional regulator [Clostridia bacterium]
MTAEFSLAVHGLVFLLHKKAVVTSEELAENICTNPARVRKVMAKLKHGGLVSSSEGKGSGYKSVNGAADITLYQVQEVLGEHIITSSWRSGSVDMDCLIASGMGDIMDEIYGNMNERCQDYLKKITIGSIQDRIFSDN